MTVPSLVRRILLRIFTCSPSYYQNPAVSETVYVPPSDVEQHLNFNHHLSDNTRFPTESSRMNLVSQLATPYPRLSMAPRSECGELLSEVLSGFEGTVLARLPELPSPLEEYPWNR